jgi:hypothetical protein
MKPSRSATSASGPQDARRIDLYTRAGDHWANEIVEGDAILELSSIGVAVSLDAITRTPTSLLLGRQRTSGKLRSGERAIML